METSGPSEDKENAGAEISPARRPQRAALEDGNSMREHGSAQKIHNVQKRCVKRSAGPCSFFFCG